MIKGVILAGGKGTRLLPATRVMNKHMVPILNRPMIEYPIETLKTLGVQDIMIVSGGNHIGDFADYLGDGSDYGVSLTYRVQKEAGGIAQALSLAGDWAHGSDVYVILGDNIFDNVALRKHQELVSKEMKPMFQLFVKKVDQPNRFGVFDPKTKRIVEKPPEFIGDLAVTGLYKYPNEIFDMIIPELKPSARGEIEVTDLNNALLSGKYLPNIPIHVAEFAGFWSDAGTPESLATVTEWALKY